MNAGGLQQRRAAQHSTAQHGARAQSAGGRPIATRRPQRICGAAARRRGAAAGAPGAAGARGGAAKTGAWRRSVDPAAAGLSCGEKHKRANEPAAGARPPRCGGAPPSAAARRAAWLSVLAGLGAALNMGGWACPSREGARLGRAGAARCARRPGQAGSAPRAPRGRGRGAAGGNGGCAGVSHGRVGMGPYQQRRKAARSRRARRTHRGMAAAARLGARAGRRRAVWRGAGGGCAFIRMRRESAEVSTH